MSPATTALEDLTLNITEEIRVHASLEDTFAALLEELGPANRGMHDAPMPMVLEAWPGGRWYRDLGENNGHCWGHVQAIRRPTLIEIAGPMMMSFAVASNIQYRLAASGSDTVITLKHNALGLFPEGYRAPLTQGWQRIFARLQARLA
ncbi:MAG: SRPBCC domain-containing protein [Vicinamibacterales bacterium]